MGEPEPVGAIMRRLAVDAGWTLTDMNRRRAVTLLVAAELTLLASAACTSPQQDGNPDARATVVSPSATPTEGPASEAHSWPNGLQMKVTAAQKMDPKLASSGFNPATHTLVKVTAALTNPGTAAVPVRNGFIAWRVLSGPNRAECDQQAGWFDPVHNIDGAAQLRTDLPQQVGAGQTLTVYDTADVPTDQLGVLAVQTGPALGDLEQWTFTGVEKLLKA